MNLKLFLLWIQEAADTAFKNIVADSITEAFAGLSDPHRGPAQRHDLREMIVMALCAVLCGADTWVDVAEWSQDNEA